MRRFWAIFKKEFRQIRRDPLSLGLLVFVPALLLVLYGYALSFDVKHIPMAVLDEDQTPESRELLDSLFQNPYFDRVRVLLRSGEAETILSRGQARAVLVVPRGYAASILHDEPVSLQALVDGSDATSAATTVGYLEALAERQTWEWRSERLARAGQTLEMPIVVLEPRIWFNPELESSYFLVPGIIAMLLMLSAVISTSLSIVREKERETMEQIMVSPVKPQELILGKTLPYVFICVVTMAMVLGLGYGLFGIGIQGSWWLLAAATLIFLFAALGMGILISSITKSQQVAFQIATIATMLPSIILSGLIFPIANMPPPIQGITLIVIPRYFVKVLRGVILKGATVDMVWPSLLAMVLLGLVFNLLAAILTRKSV